MSAVDYSGLLTAAEWVGKASVIWAILVLALLLAIWVTLLFKK